MHHSVDGHYERLAANDRGHYFIPTLGVELGIWRGSYCGYELPWMRWWTPEGVLLPTAEERAERLAAKLRELGVDPTAL
jgi:hypothetical protein